LLLALGSTALAQNQTLTNETAPPRPKTLQVIVDGYGSFQTMSANPNGVLRVADFTFQSALYFGATPTGTPPPLTKSQWLSTINLGTPALPVIPQVVVIPGRRVTSTWTLFGGLWEFRLEQFLDGPDPASGPPHESSTLQQIYRITNRRPATDPPHDVHLVRYWDTDILPTLGNDRAGVSMRQQHCGTMPPFTSNAQWVFAYDPAEQLSRMVAAASIEVVDPNGQLVKARAFQVLPFPTLLNNITAQGFGALATVLNGDTNVDLVVDPPEAGFDVTMGVGLIVPSVASGQTITVHTRSRVTDLEKKNPPPGRPTNVRARDITCITWGGNVNGIEPGLPILCVNGSNKCAGIQPGQPIAIQLSSPPANPPGSTAYIIYATVGNPKVKTFCGGPHAGDFASWGPPIGELGLASFPVNSGFGPIWSGGAANLGFVFVSNVGLGIPGGPAGPPMPCGPGFPPIILLPPLALGKFAITLQGIVLDLAARNAPGLPLSITNAVNVHWLPNCLCQDH
jgi:hypothetical protein